MVRRVLPEQQEVKVGELTKKAQNKSLFFTSDSYTTRVFVLDSSCLTYYAGTLKKRGEEKGRITLREVLAVETLREKRSPNCAFQVSYEEDGRPLILYIIAKSQQERDDWVKIIREEALKSGAFFVESYHPACWDRHNGFSCCGAPSRGDEGCMPVTTYTAEMRERLLSKASSAGAGEILVDMMSKRSQGKSSFFGVINYKERVFVLDSRSLRYFGGNLKKREGEKGSVELCTVLAVENVTESLMDNRKNAFQVVYENDDDEVMSLIMVGRSGDKRRTWVKALRDEARKNEAKFQTHYHPGVWMKGLGKYNCCQNIDKASAGCQPVSLDLTEYNTQKGDGRLGSGEVKAGMLIKRAQNKSAFTMSQSYKSRFFVLRHNALLYFSGTEKKRGDEKGHIPLDSLRVVAPLDVGALTDHNNAFQVVYWDREDQQTYLLYLSASSPHDVQAWIHAICTEAVKAGVNLEEWYHGGVWNKRVGKFTCCAKLSRDAQGCSYTLPPSSPLSPSPPPPPPRPDSSSSSSASSISV